MSSGSLIPLHVFRFHVDFRSDSLTNSPNHEQLTVCSGAFAECTGIEANMETKVIKEGGQNYGVNQRVGPTTFATVVLKRGISTNRNLFQIFNAVSTGAYAPRLQVTINLFETDGSAVLAWQLDRALPVKFKFADLNARGMEIGIEELHLVHEGLWSVTPTVPKL
jgi:phage tail-like protein